MITSNDRETVKRYKFPDRVIADYLARTIRTEGEQEYVLASDYDALLTREAALREQLVAQARAAEQWRRHAQLVEKSENHTRAERGHLRSLLTRAYTELNGDDMDKVRGVLVGEIRAAVGKLHE